MKEVASEHYEWVDVAKGLGILLVIAGHTFSGYVYHYIYLFHMPMFFFIAGFLHKKQNVTSFFKRKVRRLMKPYFFYLILFSLLLIFKGVYDGTLTVHVLIHLLARSLFGGALLTGWEGVFWFVTVFIISQQFLNLMLNYFSFNNCVLLNIILLLCAYIDSSFLSLKTPLGISMAFFVTPIMFVGYCFRVRSVYIKPSVLFIVSLLSMLLVYFYPTKMVMDIKYSEYGFFIIGFCLSIFLSLQIIYFCKKDMLRNRLLLFFGKYSFFVMFIHQFIKDILWEPIFSNLLLVYIATVFSCLVICYIFDVIRKYDLLSDKTSSWILG